jgi:hypothetical protein
MCSCTPLPTAASFLSSQIPIQPTSSHRIPNGPSSIYNGLSRPSSISIRSFSAADLISLVILHSRPSTSPVAVRSTSATQQLPPSPATRCTTSNDPHQISTEAALTAPQDPDQGNTNTMPIVSHARMISGHSLPLTTAPGICT